MSYLACSTSAFYVMPGGLFWVVSFDPPRHRAVLTYPSVAIVHFGAKLVVVDWSAGLPFFGKVREGLFVIVLGVALPALGRRLPASRERPRAPISPDSPR